MDRNAAFSPSASLNKMRRYTCKHFQQRAFQRQTESVNSVAHRNLLYFVDHSHFWQMGSRMLLNRSVA